MVVLFHWVPTSERQDSDDGVSNTFAWSDLHNDLIDSLVILFVHGAALLHRTLQHLLREPDSRTNTHRIRAQTQPHTNRTRMIRCLHGVVSRWHMLLLVPVRAGAAPQHNGKEAPQSKSAVNLERTYTPDGQPPFKKNGQHTKTTKRNDRVSVKQAAVYADETPMPMAT